MQFLFRYANPHNFMRLSGAVLPVTAIAALDASGQQLIAHLMARHCGTGGIIIAATHEPLGLGNESLKL